MVQSNMLFSDISLKYLSQNFKAMTEIFSRRSLLWIIYGNALLLLMPPKIANPYSLVNSRDSGKKHANKQRCKTSPATNQ